MCIRDSLGAERIVGTPDDDLFIGSGGANVFFGLDGDDDIRGNGGADRLYGEPGSDEIRGGKGNDRLWGGPDGDFIWTGGGSDRAWGGGGDDVIRAFNDFNNSGRKGDVTRVWGGEGDDDVLMQNRTVIVEGGQGQDDFLAFHNDDSVTERLDVRIRDMERGETLTIHLGGFSSETSAVADGGDTLITRRGLLEIRLEGVTPDQLQRSFEVGLDGREIENSYELL